MMMHDSSVLMLWEFILSAGTGLVVCGSATAVWHRTSWKSARWVCQTCSLTSLSSPLGACTSPISAAGNNRANDENAVSISTRTTLIPIARTRTPTNSLHIGPDFASANRHHHCATGMKRWLGMMDALCATLPIFFIAPRVLESVQSPRLTWPCPDRDGARVYFWE
ncbi:hypothetical protein EDC04DRAFT_655525 [Pisolithus marmoratus]|nr:hypothetical protein EDC04DRAFT_655525 [Pisolithus marmoratus]